jgi:hypothetical protein
MGATLPQGTDRRLLCHSWGVHTAVYWFGFLGAWALFTGPIFQASVELRAEDEAGDRMERVSGTVPRPAPVSNFWWLLPPVRLVLSTRRSREYRDHVLAALSAEDLEIITRYLNIARGWMLVGAGALLIALKETWELVEEQEWPTWLYWVLVVVMTVLALAAVGGSAERERRARTTTTTTTTTGN